MSKTRVIIAIILLLMLLGVVITLSAGVHAG
jgi:hypothetical protein